MNTLPIKSDLYEHAHTLALQLSALLSITYGVGRQGFEGLADDLRENFLWACADKAFEIERALREGIAVAKAGDARPTAASREVESA
jgi:hypothetical protein